jgi:outer membrane biosynthesis protein TonB
MSRPSLAIAAVLALTAAAGCAPQCTCPATAPAPVPVVAVSQPGSVPAQPGAVPTPQPQPAAPFSGPLRILNDEESEVQMRSLYPGHLADVGVGGDAVVEVTLGEGGLVQGARDISVSNPAFRGPALTVAHQLQFIPAPAPETVVRVRMRWRTASTSVEIVQP